MGTVAIFILFSKHLCSLIWWEFPRCISCLHVVGSEPNGQSIWISEYPITLTALKVDLWSTAFPFPLNIFSSTATINSQLQTAGLFSLLPDALPPSSTVHWLFTSTAPHTPAMWLLSVQPGGLQLLSVHNPHLPQAIIPPSQWFNLSLLKLWIKK